MKKMLPLAALALLCACGDGKKDAADQITSPPDPMSTHSIALRVRRVTYEDAYIAVPVTDQIVKKAEDGSFRIDGEAAYAEGIRISQDDRVEWQVESTNTEVHPIQQPAPEGRKKLDPLYPHNE
ncbi:MAG: hypothetical protein ABI432_11075 [Flavobacteriales bacterium]